MTANAKPARTMDLHLLTRVEDDGSPFGVEYSTRRLTLEKSGRVSCDATEDALWEEMAAGIPSAGPEPDEVLRPEDGVRFLDRVGDFFRYCYLGPGMPVVRDHRGPARPDDFRIVWNPRSSPDAGHGYRIDYRVADPRRQSKSGSGLPVAAVVGWDFMHEFDASIEPTAETWPRSPRLVVVNLLRRDSLSWAEPGLDAELVLRESQGVPSGIPAPVLRASSDWLASRGRGAGRPIHLEGGGSSVPRTTAGCLDTRFHRLESQMVSGITRSLASWGIALAISIAAMPRLSAADAMPDAAPPAVTQEAISHPEGTRAQSTRPLSRDDLEACG